MNECADVWTNGGRSANALNKSQRQCPAEHSNAALSVCETPAIRSRHLLVPRSTLVGSLLGNVRLQRPVNRPAAHVHECHLPLGPGPRETGASFSDLPRELIPVLNCYDMEKFVMTALKSPPSGSLVRFSCSSTERESWAVRSPLKPTRAKEVSWIFFGVVFCFLKHKAALLRISSGGEGGVIKRAASVAAQSHHTLILL